MSTQKYRDRSDGTVAENSGTSRPVHPARPELNVKPGGENKTPAPVASPSTTADIARSKSWGRSMGDMGDNSGKAGYGGASSLNPGERPAPATINPLAAKDVVLENIIRGGAHGAQVGDDWQTRPVSKDQYPTTRGMTARGAGGSPSGTVPAKTGAPVSDAAARRNAGLKRTE